MAMAYFGFEAIFVRIELHEAPESVLAKLLKDLNAVACAARS